MAEGKRISNSIKGILGGLSGVTADVFTFPFDSIKTKM